ncbi:MAG TPA: hypothetical protein DCY25_02330 [Bacteroidales bacterium]|nr:hypothetical protein [Bacteroidales bacterium]
MTHGINFLGIRTGSSGKAFPETSGRSI